MKTDLLESAVAQPLRLGGFAPLSAVDWPDQLCAVFFTQGCAWACRYCHNPHLIPWNGESTLQWSEARTWLKTRVGLLDGIVFSGGEPTLQPGLPSAIEQGRELGFQIGLHTGGVSPGTFAKALRKVDWVGFDFKAPFSKYGAVTGRPDGEAAQRSMGALVSSEVAYEIRTTWHPLLLEAEDLAEMADHLVSIGVRRWVIQRFRANGCSDRELVNFPVGDPPEFEADSSKLTIAVR